jgi:hypothetical protein
MMSWGSHMLSMGNLGTSVGVSFLKEVSVGTNMKMLIILGIMMAAIVVLIVLHGT